VDEEPLCGNATANFAFIYLIFIYYLYMVSYATVCTLFNDGCFVSMAV
jgi:hypothetical protein